MPSARTARSCPEGDWGVPVGRGVGRGVGRAMVFFVVISGVGVVSDPKVCLGVVTGPGCVSRTLSIYPLA